MCATCDNSITCLTCRGSNRNSSRADCGPNNGFVDVGVFDCVACET